MAKQLEHISTVNTFLLDELVELKPNTKLLVTILPEDCEYDAWLVMSRKRLKSAYDNADPEYPLDLESEQTVEER